jgi:hypothetical protein
MPQKKNREKSIKIRVSEEEHSQLLERCPSHQLARWMREHCLHGAAETRGRKKVPVPTCDPAKLRQLAGIGNNVNQIARKLNTLELSRSEIVQVLAVLVSMEDHLEKLRDDR